MKPKVILNTNRTGELSVSNPTVYSDLFGSDGLHHSLHYESEQTVATFAATAELWGSNKPNPGRDDNTDWVLLNSTPFATLPGGTTKGFFQEGDKSMVHYRIKFTRTTGSGHIVMWHNSKSRD